MNSHYLLDPLDGKLKNLELGEYKKLCISALERYGSKILDSIPLEMRDYDLFRAALENDEDLYTFTLLEKEEDRIGLQPAEFDKLCLEAIEIHGSSVLYAINPGMRIYKVCLAAVEKDLFALALLQDPEERPLLSQEEYAAIISTAIDKSGIQEVFPYLPPNMMTYEICLEAIKKDINLLRYIAKPEQQEGLKPGEYSNLCVEAFKTHGDQVFNYTHKEMWTYDLCRAAVIENASWLTHLNGYQLPSLRADEYTKIYLEAINKHGIKTVFEYLSPEMRTYDILHGAFNQGIDILRYFKFPESKLSENRVNITSEQYVELCTMAIERKYFNGEKEKTGSASRNQLLYNFIKHYTSVNKMPYRANAQDPGVNNKTVIDIETLFSTFFSTNHIMRSEVYPLLGNQTFLLMEKMLVTSADNLNRFLSELNELSKNAFISCSKNILRLFDNINHENVTKATAQLRIYFFLSSAEKKEINALLDASNINVETIAQSMRKVLIQKFYDFLALPFDANYAAHTIDTLDDIELADLYSLFEYLKKSSDESKSKIFFSMLKMYLGNIPSEYLHSPDAMQKIDDEHLVKMAEHNQELRAKLSDAKIAVDKAFSYKKPVTLTFDQYQKQKIMQVLSAIYKKLTLYTGNNKHIKNLIIQMEKGEPDSVTKLSRMISESSLILLKKIVASKVIDINTEYEQLKELGVVYDPSLDLSNQNDVSARHITALSPQRLKSYQPRKFHIEMWDKSKMKTFFLGDYLSCCLATTGIKRSEFAPRIFDDAFLMPVIIDETTGRPVCAAWLFFGEAELPNNEKKIDLVANFFEINAGIAENKELMNFLIANLLSYIDQFSKDVNAHEFIMRPLTYGMIPDFDTFGSFSATNKREIEKVGGYFGDDDYYLDAVNTVDFYKFDQEYFSEAMRKHISVAPESTSSGYIKKMTFGFASNQVGITERETEDHPAPTNEVNVSHQNKK